MCSIQFVYSLNNRPISEQEKTIFLDLLSMGRDYNNSATGVFSLDNNGVSTLNKGLDFKAVCKTPIHNKVIGLVGHNRLTTHGSEKENQNNHPFSFKGLTWVHNGVIRNHVELQTVYELENPDKVLTDSFVIGQLTDYMRKNRKVGVEKALALALEEIEGSLSVFLHDSKTNRLFYYKNHSTTFGFQLWEIKGVPFIVGSTDYENLDKLNQKTAYGFKLQGQNYKTLGKKKPTNNYLHEITQEGITKTHYIEQNYHQKYNYNDPNEWGNEYNQWVNKNGNWVKENPQEQPNEYHQWE